MLCIICGAQIPFGCTRCDDCDKLWQCVHCRTWFDPRKWHHYLDNDIGECITELIEKD